MERLIDRCCGLDVHKKTVTACVRVPGANGARAQHVRTFGTTTADLLSLRDWLEAFQVTQVAMESTGVYWKPVFYVLEETAICVLANAAQIAQVPGRKTDVKDCVWIAQLLEHGLIRESFVPPAPIRELRDLTRYRKAVIQERTREANRLHKVLEDAGIKLASVASRVLGVSGRTMLDALVAGTTDPAVLADLARGRLRKKLPALRQALVGRFRGHHAFLVAQILAHLDYLDEAIEAVSTQIDTVIVPFADDLTRLDTIPGVNKRTAEVLIAELGVDMRVFPTAGHLASWAGLCPGKQRECRQAPIGPDAQRQPLAARRADRGRPQRRHALCHRRPRRPLPTRHAAPRAQESGRCRRPRYPRHRLPSLGSPNQLQEPGRRLLRSSRCRARSPPRHSHAGAPRLPRNPRTRGLSARSSHGGFSEQSTFSGA